jgi:hypothetical protein
MLGPVALVTASLTAASEEIPEVTAETRAVNRA